ncbi:aminotransferase class V-fold PLP-dependent enzyme [Amycolatopsis albispora]|uniref:Aminotransferase class V n=1 Tax=Amycolatopsis albispora TaxID=1804986 RepID=A0A344L7R7_9PSEU|nr:aminotransferase class V-fold PLP-dependent enzyme [Amycolatopsis albispora]AXB44091.1 aminotransferase class V [Amycolatopsis albispora]
MIFLDSAGSSLPPPEVLDEVIGHLRREAEVGGYRAAAEREDDLERAYPVFAELLGCEPDEVAFTDSATRSWLTLVDSVPLAAGDRVLISEAEYGANAVALMRLTELAGARLELVPSDESGQLDVAALRNLLDERVKLVSLVHVPTNGGLVNPVREVAEAAHEAGALVLLDACQSVGQLPVRADELGVDLIAGTGRKWLRGPRGTGFLVVRRAVADRLRPRLFDHSGADWSGLWEYRFRQDARLHELWEFGVAERLGLVKAAEHALGLGLDHIAAEIGERAARLRAGLSAIPGVAVHDLGERPSGIVTFTVDGLAPGRVKDLLWDKDIVVSVTSEASTRFDMGRRGLSAMVRASPHYFVDPAQLDEFLTVVTGLR